MKTLTYAAVMLVVIAGVAPAMAQVQPPTPNAPIAVQAQPPLGAQEVTPVSSWAGTPGEADGIYNGYGQPNQVFGMPGAGQASASSHPAP